MSSRPTTEGQYAKLRQHFLRFLTEDSETKGNRNQAIFDAEAGWAVWSHTDLAMVMEKFDKAVAARLAEPKEKP